MTDVLGQALWEHYKKMPKAKLWIHNRYGRKEEMPVDVYFRKAEDMPDLELKAIQACKGKVLDVGAGAGSHALLLQQKNMDVVALEISSKAAEVMTLRGVKKIITQDIYEYQGERFDTILLLMNGIGLTGTVSGLKQFLQHAKQLMMPDGQLLFDSSDVAYLYECKKLPRENYYGEIDYQYEYKKQKSAWFKWLYIDQQMLTKIAGEEGWLTTILYEDDFDQYLARLTIKQ